MSNLIACQRMQPMQRRTKNPAHPVQQASAAELYQKFLETAKAKVVTTNKTTPKPSA